MTSIAPARPRTSWTAARSAIEAWRDPMPDLLKATVLFGGLVFAMHMLLHRSYDPTSIRALSGAHLLRQFASDELGAFMLFAAILVADRVTGRNPRRWGVYALAIVSSAGAWSVAQFGVVRLFGVELAWNTLGVTEGGEPTSAATLFGFLEWTMLDGAGAFTYLHARRAQEEQNRLQAAVLARSRTAKRMLESRLKAMQARVEPQFLFDTLEQIEESYRRNFALGERMLDGLIAYLRAAMPQVRDTTSTAGREIELARAYLEIARLRLGDKFAVEIDGRGPIDDVRMPPMMLLPLVDQVFAHGLGRASASGSIRIVCSAAGGVLRVVIVHSGGGFLRDVDASAMNALRDRLATLYGGEARVEMRRDERWTTEAVLELPCERTSQSRSAPRDLTVERRT